VIDSYRGIEFSTKAVVCQLRNRQKVYLSISSARYAPSIPVAEFVMNKGHGVARTVPVFCIEDYCVYYFCIKELENVLCVNRTRNTFGGWSLGGKFRQQETSEIECEITEYGRYSFNPQAWTRAFGEFNSLLFSQLDQGNYSHVLQFDLSNFYDSVRLDTLERWIREEADSEKGWIITLLFYLLNQWNRRNTGLQPQAVDKLNSKRSQPIDFAERLKLLGEKSVHNAYHHEVLAFAISIKDRELGAYCESRLASLEMQMKTNQIS
jgi:hypothetical protein